VKSKEGQCPGGRQAALDWQSGRTTLCVREPSSRVPVGYPIANTLFYILDSSLEPVSIGVPGEIFVSGANVDIWAALNPPLTCSSVTLSRASRASACSGPEI
jgi:non-ribosomal peptide synthetase component F